MFSVFISHSVIVAYLVVSGALLEIQDWMCPVQLWAFVTERISLFLY